MSFGAELEHLRATRLGDLAARARRASDAEIAPTLWEERCGADTPARGPCVPRWR